MYLAGRLNGKFYNILCFNFYLIICIHLHSDLFFHLFIAILYISILTFCYCFIFSINLLYSSAFFSAPSLYIYFTTAYPNPNPKPNSKCSWGRYGPSSTSKGAEKFSRDDNFWFYVINKGINGGCNTTKIR